MDNLSLTINGSSESLLDSLKRMNGGENHTTFAGLTDTPPDYTGHGGKLVAVKTTEDGTEFVDAPSGGGVVDKVFGRVGSVIAQTGDYTADNISETVARKIMTASEREKLAAIEAGATGDQSDTEIEAAYNKRVGKVSEGEISAGTEIGVRRFSPKDIADMARVHGENGGSRSRFTALEDTPVDFTGQAGKLVAVNSGEDALEFTNPNISDYMVAARGSTKARPLAARFAEAANVRDFAAIGDGKADDTPAIQAAIDSGAGLVVFPPGTYKVTSSIVPADKQTLFGSGGWEETTIFGARVSGGIIQGNADYSASSKQRITIDNLRIAGSADYGIYMPKCTGTHLRRLRFSFGAGLTHDCIHMGESWDSKIENIHAYTTSGRSVLWLDGDMHGLHVSDVHTTARTQYGIVSCAENGKIGGVSATQVFNQIVLQRHQVGLWLKRCRSVTVNGLYTELTQIPVRLGSAENPLDRATATTINGGRQTQLDASSQGWADNATGCIEASNCKGVTINGFRFDSVYSGSGYNAIFIKDAQAVSLNNCIRNNDQLEDWTNYIVRAAELRT